MTKRGRRHLIKPLVFALAAVALAGCITPEADSVTGRYTAPIGNSPVIANETPYSDALRCLGGFVRQHPMRIAVGQIADYTGKMESDNSGRKLTQGAALMAMSALSKAGVPLVERFDTSVAEMELKYANNKLITDDKQSDQPGDYRKILAGSIPGSDYYLVGGITELNFNSRSAGANADGGATTATGAAGTAGVNMYVMNIGLDLRLVDTNTLEVVDVISYQKQIIGRQEQVGVFDFLGSTFLHDASAGGKARARTSNPARGPLRDRARCSGNDRDALYHIKARQEASLHHARPWERQPIRFLPVPAIAAARNCPQPSYHRRSRSYRNSRGENDNDTSHQDPYRWYSSC